MNKKIIRIVIVGLLLFLAVTTGITFWLKNKNIQTPIRPATSSNSALDLQNIPTTQTPTPTPSSISDIQTQPIVTQNFIPNQLKQLSDLKLIKKDRVDYPANLVKYFEVQDIEIDGAKLVLAVDGYCDGVGCTPGYYRFLQNKDTFTLLTKYSTPIDGSYDLTKRDFDTSKTSDTTIPALDMPLQLQDPKTKAIVNLNTNSSYMGDFFNSQDKTLMFSVNGYDVFSNSNGSQFETFFVQATDGKKIIYILSDPFISNQNSGFISTLNIEWSDGQTHDNNFQIDPTGNNIDADHNICEVGQNYFDAAKSTTVSQNDLVVIGTNTNGQLIYGLKDINNPILKAAQKNIMDQPTHNNPRDLIIFWKDPFGRLIRFVSSNILNACGGKPVIYLYPTKPTNIIVQVAPTGGISKSDPTYNNGWNVFAKPNGTLTSGNKQYPYLFWEGGLNSYKMPENGFVVKKTEVKQLIVNKLTLIGLNNQEIKDFNQFWLPKMKSAPFYLITFIVNEDVDKLAPLTIKPRPDTIIRVLMDYKPLDEAIKVKEQKLIKTNRDGFTVVEWGGILK